MKRKFIYSLRELKDADRRTFQNISLVDLGTDIKGIRRLENYNAQVHLKRTATGVWVEFNSTFRVVMPCVRCLEDAVLNFAEQMHLEYVAGPDPRQHCERINLRSKDLDRVYFSGTEIDLIIGLREIVILNLPIAPLCRADCSGLCPVCGGNRNVHRCQCHVPTRGRFDPVATQRSRRKKE